MKLHTGHVLDVLQTLPERSVQCIVTSPPYWGLRKYAGEQEVVWPDGWRGAFGLEPTPALYIEHSMRVLDALRRVLRDDGVVWWNLGDSYAGNATGSVGELSTLEGGKTTQIVASHRPDKVAPGIKPKDLCLIPFRFALAAQERGWWVRSDIIWSKPNPMPESVTDRPTRAHEYIFMLTKAARYYYDAEAVKERDHGRPSGNGFQRPERLSYGGRGQENEWTPGRGRNLRSVWTITTRAYPEAHFATFPPELPRRCILASTSPKACPSCGAPWARVVERTGHKNQREPAYVPGNCPTKTDSTGWAPTTTPTNRWKPTCPCPSNDGSGRCVVLDPFCGSGTTVQVAEELNREGWGIDISEEYRELQEKRIAPRQGQKRLM